MLTITTPMNAARALLALLACSVAWLAAPAISHAKCDYTFEGRVLVDHQDFMQPLFGTQSPLVNVEVKLRGKLKAGTWNEWDTVRTDANGSFRFSKNKDCSKRDLEISVRFDSDELSVFHEKSTDQIAGSRSLRYLVWKKSIDHKLTVIDNQISLRFRANGQGALGEAEPRGHAEIWTLYRRVIAHMASYGSGFAFDKRVKVKHPHNGLGSVSYANPMNDVIYLVRNNAADDAGRDLDTMVHELMHIWTYQHSVKENRMASYLLGHLQAGTHGLVTRTHVAFHEGFAEWAKDVVMHDLFNRDLPALISRHGTGADNFGQVEYIDHGWEALFGLLQRPNVQIMDFSTTAGQLTGLRSGAPSGYRGCRVGHLPFPKLLGLIERGSKDIKANEMNWDGFFRAAVSRNLLHQRDMAIYRAMLDPAADGAAVYDVMCDRIQINKPSTYKPGTPVQKVPTRTPAEVIKSASPLDVLGK